DYGMGMTLEQIEKYFLKIGNSFYNSDDFEVSKIDFPIEDKKFTPVSRFGIGILSCFMVGDLIEISTKSVYSDNDKINPIRLSLKGIDNYYFLYTGDDLPEDMPQDLKNEKGYRKEIGTSISIRINPNYDRKEFEIHNLLENLSYASLVPIEYKSNHYGTERIEDLPNKVVKHKITGQDKERLKDFLGDANIKEINPEIHRVPIILKNENIPNVSGILYVFLLRKNITYINGRSDKKRNKNEYSFLFDDYDEEKIKWSLEYDSKYYSPFSYDKIPTLSLDLKKQHRRADRKLHFSINNLIKDLDEFNGNRNYNEIRYTLLLSHNGLIIPNNKEYYFGKGTRLEIQLDEVNSDETFCFGIINLKDDLRPNLNVARDQIISFPWNCFSQINYLIRTSLDKSKYKFHSETNYFSNMTDVLSDGIEEDFLLNDINYWPSLIEIEENGSTISELEDNKKYPIETCVRSHFRLESLIVKKSIFNHCNFNIELFKRKNEDAETKEAALLLVKKSYITFPKTYNLKSFPSYYACKYDNFNGLMPLKLNDQLYN
ncbi:MAG: hypothetical protein RLP13_02080, partial [Cytophagales bacterium]